MRAIFFCLLSACAGGPLDGDVEPARSRPVATAGVARPPAEPEPREVETRGGCLPVVEPCEEYSADPAVCGGFPECYYAGNRIGWRCLDVWGRRAAPVWGECVPVGGDDDGR